MLRSSVSWDSTICLSSRKPHPPPLACVPKFTSVGGAILQLYSHNLVAEVFSRKFVHKKGRCSSLVMGLQSGGLEACKRSPNTILGPSQLLACLVLSFLPCPYSPKCLEGKRSRKFAREVSREIRTLSEARATAIRYLRWRNVSSQWIDEGDRQVDLANYRVGEGSSSADVCGVCRARSRQLSKTRHTHGSGNPAAQGVKDGNPKSRETWQSAKS
jgi:hypothetical protein